MIEKYIIQTKTKPYLQAMQQRYWIKHRRTLLFPGDKRDASIQKPDFTLQAKSIHSFCQHPKYGTDSGPGKILIKESNDQNQNLESSRSKNKAFDDTESSQNPRFPPLNKCGMLCVCVCVCVCLLFSHVQFFLTPWTIAHQVPLSMEFSRQEQWSGQPLPSPGDLPDPGMEPRSPVLQADSLPPESPRKPRMQ